jgi:receptor protein-tyrosine kinase
VVEEPSGRDLAAQVRDLARVVREQKWLILLCIAVTTAAAAARTAVETQRFQATAKLLLQQDTLSQTLAGAGLAPFDPTRQAATDAQLVSLPAISARVVKQLKQPLSTASVSASVNGDSSVLSVNVIDTKPARAAAIANAFSQQYIVFRRQANQARIATALKTLNARAAQTPKGQAGLATLHAQIKQLRLLKSLQTGDAQLIQPAITPGAAISPKPTRNVVLGVVVGILLGFALAVLRDRLDRRLKREDDLEAIFPGVPIIALVPRPRRRRADRAIVGEAFHTLSTNVTFLGAAGPLRTLLVTSAGPADGKSTVVLNLALAMRTHGQPVLVLDADMRRPALSQSLAPDSPGLSQILAGSGTVEASIQEREIDPRMNGKGPAAALEGALTLVPAGPTPPNPQVLLQDRPLEALLEAAAARSDTVIVDGPPIGTFSDMLGVARKVDGVIVVVRLYHSRKDELRRFARDLGNAGVTPAGVVVLGSATRSSRYYAYYRKRRA